MTERIEETLRRLAGDMSKASTPTSSSTERASDRLGDPDCPVCHGIGYLRRDLPVDHPDFGRLELCECRQDEVRSRVRQRLFSLSKLDELQHMTFETFNPRGRPNMPEQQQESLERVYNAAREYAHKLQGWLLLQGGFGTGKTHMAAAIANECVSLGVPTLFLTVPDLLDSLRFAYGNEDVTFEERFEQIRQATLLVLDDLGTQNATDWAREKLFQILNYRYINRLPLVVTTNQSLEEIEGRIRSRLSDSDLVSHLQIRAPDYRRASDDIGHPELSSLGLHSHQTFGNFSLREGEKMKPEERGSLKHAYEACLAFSEKPEGWLVLTGTYGCGKTHLAAAIANYRASQGFPVMFVSVPDLLDHLRATFNPSSTVTYDRRFEEIRTAQLLVLDDLGTQATTPWVHEKLSQLFNYRYDARLPTVVTTADEVKSIDARLRSRMLDRAVCRMHGITAPSFVEARSRRRSRSN